MYQNNEMAAILVYGTGISSFLFKYFVLFHQPTGATDHVSENDLYKTHSKTHDKLLFSLYESYDRKGRNTILALMTMYLIYYKTNLHEVLSSLQQSAIRTTDDERNNFKLIGFFE